MTTQLTDAISAAVAAELSSRGRPADTPVPAAALDRPRNPGHGDYAANIALQLAPVLGTSPRELAAALAARLAAAAPVAEVQVAGPGFLNFRLTDAAVGGMAGVIIGQGTGYGQGAALGGQRINLEFVSANPTGPVVLASLRWAAVGDALARLLRSQGAAVTTEYYFNDAGAQIDRFAASLLAAARGEPAPPDGYHGAYIAEIAAEITARQPRAAADPDALRLFATAGVELMFAEIKSSLAGLGVRVRRLFLRADAARAGRASRGGAPTRRPRARVPGRRRGVGGDQRVRRRQGPGHRAHRRHVLVFRRRLRVLPGQAQPRLRPDADRARRRPPRLHRPDAGDGRVLRRRPGHHPGDPHRPAGQPAPGRPAGADVQARRRRDHARGHGVGDRRGRDEVRAGPVLGGLADRGGPGPVGQAQQRQPRLLRAVRAHQDLLAAGHGGGGRSRPRQRI